jgi:uncharacterized membrane protein
MALRSLRERALQTVCFEIGGLLIVSPVYAVIFKTPMAESAMLVFVLAVAVMLWSPLYNAVFDLVDLRLSGRVASDRPGGLRVVHALGHEASTLIVTLPLILLLTDLSLAAAIALDLGLSFFYAGYAYVFHILYDRLRPVARSF